MNYGGLIAGGVAVAVALAGMLAGASPDFERIGGLWLGAGLLWVVCGWVWPRHRWLALFGGYVSLRALVSTSPGAMAQATLLVLGVLAAVAVADLDPRSRQRVMRALVAVGAFEAALCIMQGWFLRDPILSGWRVLSQAYGHGTLGSPNVSGAWLAMVIGLVPTVGQVRQVGLLQRVGLVGLVGLLAAGILATGSTLGAIGAGAALILRMRNAEWGMRNTRPWCSMLGASGLVAAALWLRGGNFLSWRLRWEIWGLALATIQPQSWAPEEWLPLVIGFGQGAWAVAAWPLQLAHGLDHWGLADRLHNEPLQWLFEGGLIGVGILAMWAWRNRRLFRAPAVAALAIQMLAFHPLHIPATGILAIVVIGLAMGSDP